MFSLFLKDLISDIYLYYILAVENITFSYFGSAFRESTNDIAANYVNI